MSMSHVEHEQVSMPNATHATHTRLWYNAPEYEEDTKIDAAELSKIPYLGHGA